MRERLYRRKITDAKDYIGENYIDERLYTRKIIQAKDYIGER